LSAEASPQASEGGRVTLTAMVHRLITVLLATFLLLSNAAARQDPQSSFPLQEATFEQLQQYMQAGRYTSRQLVEMYLERIEKIDRSGPTLRSVIEVNPEALAIADALDAERKAKGARGPLHGVPILIKDNIDTADKMMTTAGSLALEGSIAPRDAFVVERLRAAGAVILGKTNLSEWANFRSTKSTSGWSGRGGQVKNPYALDRNPCGSSSGSGSAIAANLAAAAIGTETDGSIVCPSSVNGLVGIKPTLGLVSRAGIIPVAHSQDTAGPMTRTVADAAALLEAIVGLDPRDAVTKRAAGKPTAFVKALNADALRGARIGVARKRYFGYSPATDRMIDAALAELKARGAVIVDPADIATGGQLDDCELEILLYEFKADLNAYLKGLGPSAKVRSLEEVIAFNEREKAREMPFFGQEIMHAAQKKGPLTSPGYQKAVATCRALSRTKGIDAVMTAHRLDAIVAPTGGPAWPIDLVNGDHFLGASSTPAAVAGYPNITVPAGHVHGLPIGLSFIGRPWTEARLIGFAYAYEQATKHRQPPTFLPTLDLAAGQGTPR
jgi:amidase